MRLELEKDQNFEEPGLGSCPCNTKRSFPSAFLIFWSLTAGWIVYSVSVIPFLLMPFCRSLLLQIKLKRAAIKLFNSHWV